MLRELPFYDELKIIKTAKAFKKYARIYSIEIMKDNVGDMNDLLAQLEAVIKNLLKDLLIEMKGFKYQITMKVLLSKQKENGDTEKKIEKKNNICINVFCYENNLAYPVDIS